MKDISVQIFVFWLGKTKYEGQGPQGCQNVHAVTWLLISSKLQNRTTSRVNGRIRSTMKHTIKKWVTGCMGTKQESLLNLNQNSESTFCAIRMAQNLCFIPSWTWGPNTSPDTGPWQNLVFHFSTEMAKISCLTQSMMSQSKTIFNNNIQLCSFKICSYIIQYLFMEKSVVKEGQGD